MVKRLPLLLILWASLAHASLVNRFTDHATALSGTCPSIAVDALEQNSDYLHIAVCIQSSTVTSVTCPSGFTQEYLSQANAISLLVCKKTASSESGSYSPSWSGTCGANSEMLLTDVYETSGTAPVYDLSGTPATTASAGGITAPSIGTMAQSGESVYFDFCTTSTASNTFGATATSFLTYFFGVGAGSIGEDFVGSSSTTLPKTPAVTGTAAKAWIAGSTAIKGVAGAAVMVSTQTAQDTATAATSVTLTPSGYGHVGDWEFAYVAQDANVGGAVTAAADIAMHSQTSTNSAPSGNLTLTLSAGQVAVGDLMIEAVGYGAGSAITPPAGATWTEVCHDLTFGKFYIYKRIANSTDAAGTSYVWATGQTASNGGFADWQSISGQSLDVDSNSACTHVTGGTTPSIPVITTQANNEQVQSVGMAFGGVTLTVPTGETQIWKITNGGWSSGYFFQGTAGNTAAANYTSSGTQNYNTATIGIRGGSAAGSPWTPVFSGFTDPTTTGSRSDLFSHKIGSNELSSYVFTFPSAGQSSGQIWTVGNLDSTTPVVESGTLGLSGALGYEMPLVTPTTADELCLFGVTKGIGGSSTNAIVFPTTLWSIIPPAYVGFGGGKTGNIISTAYGGIQTCQSIQQATYSNADPTTGWTVAVKAATAPTHPTAIERVDQAYMIEMGAVGAAGGTASGEVIMP